MARAADVLVIGPGLLGKDDVQELLEALLPALADTAVVLDAVALSALARCPPVPPGARRAGRPGRADPEPR